mmetsp:Transcript_70012/g.130892  ORF Transcript_70012/g.130892 Transcript_70012/m.130892 type:complete len:227 (-) Transcript_70012:125-805(-)
MSTEKLNVKLYHYPLTRSVRVLWLLHELGDKLTFTTQRLELMKGEGYSSEFMMLNPNHAVPVVTFQDHTGQEVVMFESCAIMEYLTEAFAAGELAPPVGVTKERADYQKWLWFAGSWMDQLLWQLRQHHPGGILPPADRDERVVDRTKAKWVKEVEPQIIQQLEATGSKFILGEQFTAADIVTGHCLRWSGAYGLSKQEPLKDYLKRLAERPAWKAAYADADQFGK